MTTSNLLNLVDGRAALTVAARFLLERRLSRFFKRNLVIDYNQWLQTGQFTLDTLLGSLNGLNDQEILNLYHLLGTVGGLTQSIADTTIYVNGVTGDDATGDGTASAPFKTLSFMETIPSILNHKYRVVITGDVSDPTRDLFFNFEFGPGGSFALIGSGLPTVLLPGTVINAFQDLEGQGGSRLACASGLGAQAETSFLRSKNYAVPCHKIYGGSDALIQTRQFTYAGVVPTDTVDVVRPARTLLINTLGSYCHGYAASKQSQLVIANLNIDFTPVPVGPPPPFSTPTRPRFKWHNDCVSSISFVRFLQNWMNYGGNSIKGGYLNTDIMIDDVQIKALAACGLDNLDNPDTDTSTFLQYICGAKFDGLPAGGNDIVFSNATITAVDLHARCTLLESNFIDSSCFGQLIANLSESQIGYCILDGLNTAGLKAGGLEATNSNVKVYHITVLESDNVFSIFGGCFLTITECGSSTTFSIIGNAGLYCDAQNFVDAFYDDPTVTPLSLGMTGAWAQIMSHTKTAPSVPHAWPALDTPTICGHTNVIVEK